MAKKRTQKTSKSKKEGSETMLSVPEGVTVSRGRAPIDITVEGRGRIIIDNPPPNLEPFNIITLIEALEAGAELAGRLFGGGDGGDDDGGDDGGDGGDEPKPSVTYICIGKGSCGGTTIKF